MQDGDAPPPLTFARRVTRKHGEAFADGWLETVIDGGSMFDVFEETGLIKWPEDDPDRPLGQIAPNPRQDRYQDIEDEILKRSLKASAPPLLRSS